MQISFVMLIFLLFSDQISEGGQKSPRGANCLSGRPHPPRGRKPGGAACAHYSSICFSVVALK